MLLETRVHDRRLIWDSLYYTPLCEILIDPMIKSKNEELFPSLGDQWQALPLDLFDRLGINLVQVIEDTDSPLPLEDETLPVIAHIPGTLSNPGYFGRWFFASLGLCKGKRDTWRVKIKGEEADVPFLTAGWVFYRLSEIIEDMDDIKARMNQEKAMPASTLKLTSRDGRGRKRTTVTIP